MYTGDVARRDAEGCLWFEGRKKEIIIRDGVNISPQEMEEAIYNHEAMLEDRRMTHRERVPSPAFCSSLSLVGWVTDGRCAVRPPSRVKDCPV
jgi:acyl-CoA synthetase (AMP-forming)/AMP-acid ligase II